MNLLFALLLLWHDHTAVRHHRHPPPPAIIQCVPLTGANGDPILDTIGGVFCQPRPTIHLL